MWLHAFARCERWKEEQLLSREEVRRLGAWYSYTVARSEEQLWEIEAEIKKTGSAAVDRLGFANMLRCRLKEMKKDMDNLPELAKEELHILNPDHVSLGAG